MSAVLDRPVAPKPPFAMRWRDEYVWLIDEHDNHICDTPMGRYMITPVPTNHGHVRYCANGPDYRVIGTVMDDVAEAKRMCRGHFETTPLLA